MTRRALLSAFVVLLAACTRARRAEEERCAFCGMRIDPASPWRCELVSLEGAAGTRRVTPFDTPRCALRAWRGGKVPAQSLRVQEFYDRTWRDGAELRFAVGSDVIGPMGADLVPIDPSRVAKFRVDHAASDTFSLDAITAATLDAIR